jgi:radical SAM protein with 4Fe4S-binding SPASM domain
MGCAGTEQIRTEEYIRQFNAKAEQLRVPLSGSINLTHTCNLRCVHCYIGEPSDRNKMRSQEMDTCMIHSIVDEITNAGCLELLITGGEPLMRNDFPEIYRHVKQNGVLPIVFSNGTLIDEQIIDLFEELPPQTIEISLYGATADTYERITGIKGSYQQCLSGIEKLIKRKIRVKLKTVLMTLNSHEFTAIEKIAEDFGVRFRFDAAIFPRFDGDKAPMKLRVSPEEAIEREFSDPKQSREWETFFIKHADPQPLDSFYHCGAGITHFHIDAYGNLCPCLMSTDVKYNLREGSFLTGWNSVIPLIFELKPPPDYACTNCFSRNVCGYCPPFFRLENGSPEAYSEYICKMGGYRYQKIQQFRQERRILQ